MIRTVPLAGLVLAAALAGLQTATAIVQPPNAATPVVSAAGGTGVPMFRGDPAHTGVHPGPGPAGDPTVRWRVDFGSPVLAAPAVVDGVVYVGSDAEPADDGEIDDDACVLHALDAKTGAERWRVAGACGSPAVAGGLVFATDGDWAADGGALVALDAASGQKRWRFAAEGRLGMAPTVAGGVVYVGGESDEAVASSPRSGRVYALDATTGRVLWRIQIGDEHESSNDTVESAPAVVDGGVYFGIDHSGMYATGAERWHFRPGHGMFASPSVVDGVVYNGALDGNVFAVDAATGRERWRFDAGDAVFASPAVVDGVVYVGAYVELPLPGDETAGDGVLYALAADSGRERWRRPGGPGAISSPAVVDGVVYVGGAVIGADGAITGALHAIDAATGSELWRIPTGQLWSSPAVVDGVVYVADIDGVLYAVGGSAGA